VLPLLVPLPLSLPEELLPDPDEVVPVPVDAVPEVVEVVPAKRKPVRMPVAARLPMPMTVVMPTAARRPADRLSMSWPPSRRPLIPACSGILSASLIRMGGA
jgi:hypothetical protein